MRMVCVRQRFRMVLISSQIEAFRSKKCRKSNKSKRHTFAEHQKNAKMPRISIENIGIDILI